MIVRTIASTSVAGSSVVAPFEGTSPLVITGLGGGGGATTPVVGTSPARAIPQRAHARTTANVKRLILSVFSFEFADASQLARNHISVYTYTSLDTA